MSAETSNINSLKPLSAVNENVSRANSFAVHPDLLLEEEGFNTRAAFCEGDYYSLPEVVEHINKLAHAYATGQFVPPLLVKVKGGKIYVRDGHCRLRAIRIAIKNGANIKKIQVIEIRGDDAEQAVIIATSNDGLKISPMARAVLYGKLEAWGWTIKEIAEKVGQKAPHVKQHLALLDLPIALKYMVQSGLLSATYALQLYAEHGVNVENVIAQAQNVSKDQGAAQNTQTAQQSKDHTTAPKKLTKKHIEKGPRLDKKLVTQMHTSFKHISSKLNDLQMEPASNSFVLKLNADEVHMLRELQQKLELLENDASKENADKQTSLSLA